MFPSIIYFANPKVLNVNILEEGKFKYTPKSARGPVPSEIKTEKMGFSVPLPTSHQSPWVFSVSSRLT